MAQPNFTGRWIFNKAKSRLEIPAPDSSMFVVDHNGDAFRLERTHVFHGRPDTIAIDLTIGGAPTVAVIGGMRVVARATWVDQSLVFESELSREDWTAFNVVRYELTAPDTIVATERFRSEGMNYDNIWWLDSV